MDDQFVTVVKFPTIKEFTKLILNGEEVPIAKDEEKGLYFIFTKGGRPTVDEIARATLVFELRFLQYSFEDFVKLSKDPTLNIEPLPPINTGGIHEQDSGS